MIRHFYLDKTNTIIENSRQNFGINPILMVGYGDGIMRGLIHFDMNEIKSLIEDKTFTNIDKLRFTLKMTNCFSVAGVPYEERLINGMNKYGRRAASCELMLFELPCEFDAGRGFDFIDDIWVHDTRSFSTEGSTWFQSKTSIPWSDKYEKDYDPVKNPINQGIFSLEKLEEEYKNYKEGKDSIVVGTQKFDFGDEQLSIDITKYVLKSLDSGYNYGLCLSFTPFYEKRITEKMQCLNFFTDHTNTFFHPYIEASYNECIADNRDSFYIGQENRLYLYTFDNGSPINLDKLPKCSVEEKDMEVKQASKGVYYAVIPKDIVDMEEDTIYYDIWSEIALNGTVLDDIEMEFVALKKGGNLTIGNSSKAKKTIVPYVSGINDGEEVTRNEVREVSVEFREQYSSESLTTVNDAEFRLFVKDGNREIDVISFQPIEHGFLNNFFLLYTADLIPNNYFVDIKLKQGREVQYYKEVLRFKVVDNVTERYQ